VSPSTAGDETRARLLIVDDEPENLRLLERAFRDDFEIFTAPDGSVALEVALRVKPQVVITDQRMPAATGVELLINLRRHLPDTVRVLITGYVDHSTLVDAVNLAMVHHYMEKPVQIRNLVDAVRTLCHKPPG
jgi:response regulator RpfG family c-di-GMP phosphodiesterase